METIHGKSGHDVHGCHLLRERDAVPDRSEVAVGGDREELRDNVRDEQAAGNPSSAHKVP